ncbi:hypothetical protein HJFPF1_12717 [Paramyrothecium foliicola]|nr:hypothetical protein HJFPF1_12717 [Paramyrothecium foliicola]
MSSSNPFRKKASHPSNRLSALDTGDTSSLSSPSPGPHDEALPDPPAGPAPDERKTKPIKKVRVLSPPPLSPDSPEWPHNTVMPYSAAESFTQPTAAGLDPFNGAASATDSDRDSSTATPPPPQPQLQPSSQPEEHRSQPILHQQQQRYGHVPPANPFSKTLHDLENSSKNETLQQERQDEGVALKAANSASRKSLNVDSFRRLLMTGNADDAIAGDDSRSAIRSHPAKSSEAEAITWPVTDNLAREEQQAEARLSPPTQLKNHEHDSAQKPADDDDLSHSDSSTDVQIGSRGKKAPPPPPSSRHGKSLMLELKSDAAAERPATLHRTPSDLNKALPPPPARSLTDEETDSIFDREAAGKVPEWDPMQSPPPVSSNGGKKPVPAPPPRRGHARAESRSQVPSINTLAAQAAHKATDDEPSSLTPSRSSSIRHSMPAPAPPPPRRPQSGSRQISSSSPTATSFPMSPLSSPPISHENTEVFPEPSDYTDSLRDLPAAGNIRLSAPPPPPKRNTSVRRPMSIQSVDAISRRIPRSDGSAPPPPPPRARGSSRSSIEGPPRRTSLDGFVKLQPSKTAPAQSHVETASENITSAPSKGVDILADLSALQREVDALRGKLG